ncbi:MAG TPA: thioredoxin-disulfide reductase [Candidatus Bathyarchaeota archaeon]|nr:thioredoxin-disulfide reductase [Candidatus Bathyarchaeota archaeon]
MEEWELIIIGAGPAGLTAGIYAGRRELKTLILEEKIPGGAAADSPLIENYPGFKSIGGRELMNRMLEHCKSFGAQIHELESVKELSLNQQEKVVKTARGTYRAKAIIVATGSHHRELGVPGEKEFRGRGVSYCATCDGPFFKDKRVIVVGGGNTAAVSALFLADIASEVSLIHRRNQLRAEEAIFRELQRKGVKFFWNSVVKEIRGENLVKSTVIYNQKTGETREIEVDGVFINIGEEPNSQIAKAAGIKVDERGYIIVDSRQRTNISGVYAAGDVTNCPVKQIGTAVGQGIIAAEEAYGYVRRPYYYKE